MVLTDATFFIFIILFPAKGGEGPQAREMAQQLKHLLCKQPV